MPVGPGPDIGGSPDGEVWIGNPSVRHSLSNGTTNALPVTTEFRRSGFKTHTPNRIGNDAMSLNKYIMPALIVGVVLLGLGMIASRWLGSANSGATVSVNLPRLSATAAEGKRTFDANCASCHGANGSGTDQGPPLVHDIYNPGHHDDASFYRAARNGVPQHHWRFGNMPPQPKVRSPEIASIIQYVREMQRANGIFYRPHRM